MQLVILQLRQEKGPAPHLGKKIAKKLLLDEHAENEDDDCGHDTAKPSSSTDD